MNEKRKRLRLQGNEIFFSQFSFVELKKKKKTAFTGRYAPRNSGDTNVIKRWFSLRLGGEAQRVRRLDRQISIILLLYGSVICDNFLSCCLTNPEADIHTFVNVYVHTYSHTYIHN